MLTARCAGQPYAGQQAGRTSLPARLSVMTVSGGEATPHYGVTGVTGVAPLMAKPSSTISGWLPGKNMRAPGANL